MLSSLLVRLIGGFLILAAVAIGAFVYGHHEGSLAGDAAVAKYVAAERGAVAKATQAAASQQQAADALQIAQQAKALEHDRQALAERNQTVKRQAESLHAMDARLRQVAAKSSTAATWLGPLPPALKAALNGRKS